jgi:hypothetical protein
MPTIICSYCEYVGQGDDEVEQYSDAEAHEEYCEARLANVEADKIDAAYEQARDEGTLPT